MTTRTIIVALLAICVTGDVSAQIRFSGDKDGLNVNGKIIDTGNLHESLFSVVEFLSVSDKEFTASIPGAFPLRANVNGVVYEIWRDRIVESCDTRKVDLDVQVQVGPYPSWVSVPFRWRKRHPVTRGGRHC